MSVYIYINIGTLQPASLHSLTLLVSNSTTVSADCDFKSSLKLKQKCHHFILLRVMTLS